MYTRTLVFFSIIWDNTNVLKRKGIADMNRLHIMCAVVALAMWSALGGDLPWKMEGSTIRTAASECPSDAWSAFCPYAVCRCTSPTWESLIRNEWTSCLSDVEELRTTFGIIISIH